MKNFLEGFRIGDKVFEEALRADFARVRGTDKVHRDMGVQKNHLLESAK